MKKILFTIPLFLTFLFGFSSCLGDDDDEIDKEWKETNIAFYNRMCDSIVDGVKYYEEFLPVWAPGCPVLIHWHNDRSLTEKNLSPMDNSTVDVKYQLRDFSGTVLDSSYSSTTYGDSIYRTKPYSNVTGFWYALTQMHVGDSVTIVLPYISGYGAASYGSVQAYSTLIFDIKLKDIVAWEKPV